MESYQCGIFLEFCSSNMFNMWAMTSIWIEDTMPGLTEWLCACATTETRCSLCCGRSDFHVFIKSSSAHWSLSHCSRLPCWNPAYASQGSLGIHWNLSTEILTFWPNSSALFGFNFMHKEVLCWGTLRIKEIVHTKARKIWSIIAYDNMLYACRLLLSCHIRKCQV